MRLGSDFGASKEREWNDDDGDDDDDRGDDDRGNDDRGRRHTGRWCEGKRTDPREDSVWPRAPPITVDRCSHVDAVFSAARSRIFEFCDLIIYLVDLALQLFSRLIHRAEIIFLTSQLFTPLKSSLEFGRKNKRLRTVT